MTVDPLNQDDGGAVKPKMTVESSIQLLVPATSPYKTKMTVEPFYKIKMTVESSIQLLVPAILSYRTKMTVDPLESR